MTPGVRTDILDDPKVFNEPSASQPEPATAGAAAALTDRGYCGGPPASRSGKRIAGLFYVPPGEYLTKPGNYSKRKHLKFLVGVVRAI